jgi:hypothetical protein
MYKTPLHEAYDRFLHESRQDNTLPYEEVVLFHRRCIGDVLKIPAESPVFIIGCGRAGITSQGYFRRAFEDFGLEFGPKLKAHCEDVLDRPYNAFFEIRQDKWKQRPHRERIERVLPFVSEVAKDVGFEV